MRKSAKIITALSVAGLTVAAGSAFTAGNTFVPGIEGSIKGYGQVQSTGIVVASMTFATVDGNASMLDKVTFTTGADVSGKTASMTLKDSAGVVLSLTCDAPAYLDPTSTIICNPTENVLLSSFDTTGLTVL